MFFGRLCDLYGRKRGFLIGMLWQMVFAIGLGFAKSESISLPLPAKFIFTSPSLDGITLDVLRGLQGMGAAAAMPAAVRRIAFPFTEISSSTLYSSASWLTLFLPRVRGPRHSQRLPLVLPWGVLSGQLWEAFLLS